MQKFKRIFSAILFIAVIVSVFFPISSMFRIVDVYDYNEFRDKINISSEKKSFVYEGYFSTPRTSYVLEIDGYNPETPDDVNVEWIVDGKSYHRHLDIDNILPSEVNTTFPFITDPRREISVRITFLSEKRPRSISLITSNQESTGKKIVYKPSISRVDAVDNAGLKIVTRAEWGADETLRYVPVWKREAQKKEWEQRGKKPKVIEETMEDRSRRLQAEKEYNEIIKSDIDANTVVRLIRNEDTNKLIFPIRTAKKINRIFVHHTAEQLKESDDATMIRAIYMYHAKTKGWGDIGYSYLIGQRGVIYEGRAGGAYVEGAHAFANNLGTVGISVIGNYENLHLNRDQRRGLVDAISYIAKKYGVDVSKEITGIQPCTSSEKCQYKKVKTYGLVGHKEVSTTSCPGANIDRLLPEIRKEIVGKIGKVSPVLNTDVPYKESIDPENQITFTLKDNLPPASPPIARYSTGITLRSPPSLGGKKIKIRLSYPHDYLSFESASAKKQVIRLDGKIIPSARNTLGSVHLSGKNLLTLKIDKKEYTGRAITVTSDIVRLPTWSRIPLWDSAKRYNDNIFRGRLIFSNQGGKLLVVNELPIEDYLKGLGEVSDSDHSEKIKTIIVAARSYAYFYRDPKNRKYNTKLYDGSDNPDEFQRYLGYGYELRSPNVAEFVKKTKGEVITFEGRLIKPWYFSSSDGRTLSYKQYCEANNPGLTCKDIPYLQSVDDPAGAGRNRSGHGVGISGVGATYAANNGKNYQQIIAYYLKGTLVRNIETLK